MAPTPIVHAGREEVTSGSFLIRTEDGLQRAPLLETRVEIAVTGIVARARVTQSFRNPGDDWVEGVYVFPLPDDAAVDGLVMTVGERQIEGVIQRRQEARRTYERAAREGRRASLVEQERPNLFTTRVAQLGPGETLSVSIEYQEELDYQAGGFSLRFPTVVAPRYIPGSSAPAGLGDTRAPVPGMKHPAFAGFHGTGWARNTDQVPDASRVTPPVRGPHEPPGNPCVIEVSIDAGLPLARVSSPSHAIRIESGPAGDVLVRLADGAVAADADFVLEWQPEVGTAPAAALFSEEFEGDTYVLLMVMPPEPTALPVRSFSREAIFVIDVSGSMHGASLAQARRALDLAIQRLGPDDRFNVIPFASGARALFPVSIPASVSARARAREFVAGLAAGGGTEMMGALELALYDPESGPGGRGADPDSVRQVVFITDGAVGNERALFGKIQRDLGRSRLFTVGIGSAPNAFFMRRAAQFGRGTASWIGSPDEVARKMGELFAKLENPALRDIQVHFPSSGTEVWPARVPDLYLAEPVMVVARVPRLGGEVRIEGSRGRVPFRVDLPFAGGGPGSGLHKLWARRKVAALMDARHDGTDGADGASGADVEQAIAELGMRHHLVTRYTSLVAVERVPSAPRSARMETRNVPGNLPQGWSHAHVFGGDGVAAMIASQGMPQTATPAGLFLAVGLAALLSAGLLAAGAAGPNGSRTSR